MRRMFLIVVCTIVSSVGPLLGQAATLTGVGYADPCVIHVAPGQITTLFVTGLKTVLSQPVNATSIPLPIMLAGISVTLNQPGNQPTPVPLLSVQQVSVCNNGGVAPPESGLTPDCLITSITIQIPFELAFVPAPPGTPPTTPELVVSENGNVSKAFRVLPLQDNLHVINTCDVFPSPKVTSAGFCVPLVTHANGTVVTTDNPVQPGEDIVIWALGLGATTPTPKTGQPSPTPAATLSSRLYLQFDFRINASPSRPYINPHINRTAPIFAGLTPGQVGLYQINVRIPSSIPAVDRCGLPTSDLPTGTTGGLGFYNIVQSNLTIDIGANASLNASFDGAAICVQPPQ
jgi:uncharacterized protein (TIGR03437 family)